MAEERTNIIKVVVDADEAQKQLSQNLLLIEKNKEAIKDETSERKKRVKELKAQGASEEKLNGVLKESATKVNSLKEANKNLGKQNRDLQKDVDVVRGSLNEQRLQLVRLNRQYDNFRVGIDGTEEDFKALGTQIKSVSDNVKGQEEATGRAQRNVGNYSEAIKQATADMGLADGALGTFQSSLNQANKVLGTISGSLSDMGKDLKDVAKGQKTAAEATKILGKAMIALPIIAIVAALTSLVALFASTQEGADKLQKILQPLRVGFEKLLGIAQELATGLLTDLFNDPIQVVKDLGNAIVENVINRFKALIVLTEGAADIFKGDFSKGAETLKDGFLQLATGVEDFEDKVKNAAEAVGEFFDEAVAEGERYANLQIRIEKQEIRLIRLRGQLNKTIAEQKKLGDDVNQTLRDRVIAIDEAVAAEQRLQAERLKLIDLQIEQIKLEQTFNDTSRESIKELALLEEERANIQREFFDRTKELQNKQNQLVKQAEAERSEAQVEAAMERLEILPPLDNKLTEEFIKNSDKRIKQSNKEKNEITEDVTEISKVWLERADAWSKASAQMAATSNLLLMLVDENSKKEKGIARALATIDFIQELGNIWLNAASPAFAGNVLTGGIAGAALGATLSAAAGVRYGARLNEISKAAGGGTFMTTKPTMLMVGDNPGGVERITVEPVSGKGQTTVNSNSGLIKMAGGGELISRPQTLAADISNDATQSVMKTIKANQMVVPVEQVNEVNRRITAVENLARL